MITCGSGATPPGKGKVLLTDEVTIPAGICDMAVKRADSQLEGANAHHRAALFTMSQDSIKIWAPVHPSRAGSGGRAPTRGNRAPGHRWKNHGFWAGYAVAIQLCHDVLAALVEAVSQTRFADYVREHIFAPLSTWKTARTITPSSSRHRAAVPL